MVLIKIIFRAWDRVSNYNYGMCSTVSMYWDSISNRCLYFRLKITMILMVAKRIEGWIPVWLDKYYKWQHQLWFLSFFKSFIRKVITKIEHISNSHSVLYISFSMLENLLGMRKTFCFIYFLTQFIYSFGNEAPWTQCSGNSFMFFKITF